MVSQEKERQSVSEQADRILVALDASPHSVAALRAAAELAALLEAELEGLFVEDINLLHLCGLPFTQEVGSYTASVRQLDNRGMERQLRTMAVVIREAMESVAGQMPVRWTFRVRRGPVVAELLAASQSAAMLSLGRASQRQRKTLGSTAESVVHQTSRPVLILGEEGGLKAPLTVLYTGTEAADRALTLAIRLNRRNRGGLRVLVWTGPEADVDANALRARIEAMVGSEAASAVIDIVDEPGDLPARLARDGGGTLVLPGERSYLLAQFNGPVLLVP